MCGVVAICAYGADAGRVDRGELTRIRQALRRRGPDDSGEWFDDHGRVGLGHTRLSILDLNPRATQPMATAGGELVITYNGEIYNYRSLRDALEAKGHCFQTSGDTEVLLYMYLEYGRTMLDMIRGMFSFVLWDVRDGSLLAVRDPYGIKPLYFANDGRTIRFASQVKALLSGGGVSPAPDSAGLVGFCLFGHLPEPFTSHRDIQALPAGCAVTVAGGQPPRLDRYFSIAACWRDQSRRRDDAEVVAAALKDSVAAHLVSDVPVGVFLSSGIDSAAVLGLMRETSAQPIEAVTLRFSEFKDTEQDEGPLAAEIARRYGASHHDIEISRQEVADWLPRFLEDMDQPTIDGLNTWLVSKAAVGIGLKVALSGLGGDELFGGYPSFTDLPRWVRTGRRLGFMPGVGLFAKYGLSLARLLGASISPKAEGLASVAHTWPGAYLVRRGLFMPWELEQVLGTDLAQDGLARLRPFELVADAMQPDPGFDFGRVATLEAALYMRNQLLRDADWAGMSHSLEVRTPLVDATLLKTTAPALRGNKALRSKATLAAAPARPLPAGLATRAKTGFGVPIGEWLDKLPELDAWNRVPILRAPGCHWARRWAYTVMAPSLEAAACVAH